MVVLAQSRIEPRAGPQLQDHGRDGAGANGQATTSFPARSGGSDQARKASATVPKAKPLSPWTKPAAAALSAKRTVYFTEEKAVGARNEFATFQLIGPSASVSARMRSQSGSVAKAFHFCSRSASDSQASR